MKRLCLIILSLFAMGLAHAQTTWDIGDPIATDVTATLSGNTLTINGTGAMQDFPVQATPWFDKRYVITTVVVNKDVTSIGSFTFLDCYNLTSITLPESLTSIGNYAFYYCYNLTSIFIPESVISIGNYAFWNCYNLTSIVIPEGVTTIKGYAFAYCRKLTSVTNLNPVPQKISSDVFYDLNLSADTLIVSCGSLAAYQAAEGWKEFGTIIEDCSCPVVSNVKANFSCPEQVTVTYDITTTQPTNVKLLYSPNGGKTWLTAKSVTGNLLNQSSDTGKTITWNNRADNVLWGNFKLKVEVIY